MSTNYCFLLMEWGDVVNVQGSQCISCVSQNVFSYPLLKCWSGPKRNENRILLKQRSPSWTTSTTYLNPEQHINVVIHLVNSLNITQPVISLTNIVLFISVQIPFIQTWFQGDRVVSKCKGQTLLLASINACVWVRSSKYDLKSNGKSVTCHFS